MTNHYVSSSSTHALAQGLGWFSIGLGLAQLLAPRRLATSLGMDEHSGLIQAYGAREIATGIGILTQSDPTPWIWGRVGGDVLDLATLAAAVPNNPRKGNALMAMMAVAGVAALDVICAQELAAHRQDQQRRRTYRDYSNRSGMPRPIAEMRGAARDFEVPKDMRIPELLRPWTSGNPVPNDNRAASSSETTTSTGVTVGQPSPSGLKPQLSSAQTVKTAHQTVT
ncbi:MAG TPA: DUF4267 domain-containing protein [Geminicoccus sp.]|jgi:hypothetical protein|uniref:DUF4267 domain-containing protein n=1 Tax=Geminicoccus sp. TaxID=2024832 RepID=UPI002E331591|nr:DUF4267 domain-containing protein [Geminicoccus sp.]HEX2527753.1 DUF4267 domain-containing protein [Geminicoccus sp.]